MNFKLTTNFRPAGDQIKAIKQLNSNIENKVSHQVLLGGTGTGKTFTIANVINKQNKPTLVLSHNKTLAGQLYSELKQFFPNNNVEYFISNFDFYQPEAYKPSSDLYIEKSSKTNWNIELLRLNALNSILTKKDTIIVA
ncbi:MAG: excinuclease ABC subunit B, partial [Mycoplasma sp.]|nr:excinuclease ABC subunit B [Mycoplasma sp.]